jgi:hypothetical protein
MKRRDDASFEYSDVTVPAYEVDAQIGGKLAQLGGRLIDSTAKNLASEFFVSFGSAAVAGADAPKSRNAAQARAVQQNLNDNSQRG